jgi:hypothetical protein
VAALKKAGILPAANRTDPAQGLYESDTGQLVLDAPRYRLHVITPRLEGACVDSDLTPGRVALRNLIIESTSVPAAVTAIAVDDQPLAQSRRILVVYATDALNSGMTFTSPSRETLSALGKTPVLLRTGKLKVTLADRRDSGLKVWALALDGRRMQPIETSVEGTGLSVSIDTSKLKTVTPFFEIAVE